ncbi:tetratricopeptide repeat protein [Fulvivirgaceae bacterium BMA10]|uniref:Tetratricopeptide repeat protein n=1 Tax=Splendidivirga corallicola TaxID=3051826 RepID=A0ABT8KXG5_9BACT|nr:tetratricopeptide repeat protein [Fulvivirgaceae bacterium BMA10]
MSHETNIKELLQEAWSKRRVGNYDEARDLVKKAQSLCKKDDHLFLGRIYHIYMQFESDQDNYAEALALCQQSLEHYMKTGNPNLIAHSTRHIADLQRHLGLNIDSEHNYRKAIDIYRNNANTTQGELANALRGFGILLEELGKVEEAIAVWKETKELYDACDIQEGVDEANDKLDLLLD